MKYIRSFFALILALVLATAPELQAQQTLEKDYSFVMNVPSVITIASSPAHLYVLSETDGMAVFRSQADSLRWLYSSTGMQRRGSKIVADIRFAYLFGNSPRLTILEPTSILGVYSSTDLPAHPLDVKRLGQQLYLALGDQGIGKISLETSSDVDAGITFVGRSELEGEEIVSLEGTTDHLYALSTGQRLYRFNAADDNISHNRTFDLSDSLTDLFLIGETLYGSDTSGNIFEIGSNGDLSRLGSTGERITDIVAWKDWLVIRGASGRVWTSYKKRSPELWKEDEKAGNHVTVAKNNLWLSEYGQITKVDITQSAPAPDTSTGNSSPAGSGKTFALKKIKNYTIPHTKPLIFPIELEGDVPAGKVRFTYQSPDIKDAEVRGQSFYWDPTSDDVGTHSVEIIASASDGSSSSTRFNIHVRSFNSPPRFTPVRSLSIPAGEPFSLPLNAVDSDGINKDLIRFLGVNLPKGANLDESTGTIHWTPTARQSGENTFRVIATDQYGAAASVDVTITVIDNMKQAESAN